MGDDQTISDKMILVMIKLSSGYILPEEPPEDRTYETWKEKVFRTLKMLGLKVVYMVSAQFRKRCPGYFSVCPTYIVRLFEVGYQMEK